MEIRVLRYFLTVAKEQSFTKAAEVLHITQPTLSRQLAGLEKELGVTLFDRSGHHITLTDEGLLLKKACAGNRRYGRKDRGHDEYPDGTGNQLYDQWHGW